jgi:hypothetical protein
MNIEERDLANDLAEEMISYHEKKLDIYLNSLEE